MITHHSTIWPPTPQSPFTENDSNTETKLPNSISCVWRQICTRCWMFTNDIRVELQIDSVSAVAAQYENRTGRYKIWNQFMNLPTAFSENLIYPLLYTFWMNLCSFFRKEVAKTLQTGAAFRTWSSLETLVSCVVDQIRCQSEPTVGSCTWSKNLYWSLGLMFNWEKVSLKT